MFIVKERFVLKSSYVLQLPKFSRDWKRAFKNKKKKKKSELKKKHRHFNMTEDFLTYYIFMFINLHKTM